jgi:hypothetical protein
VEVPTPFDEGMIEERFWKQEEWDINLPSPGFITDFILRYRGIETPTKLQVWSALFIISSVVKRDAWFKSFPRPYLLNLFVFLVAPYAICAKTWAITSADVEIVSTFHSLLPSLEERAAKTLHIVRTRGTSEGIFHYLKPRSFHVINPDTKKFIKTVTDSSACFIISELATFLNKKQYNTGLIDDLTNLFDCRPIEDKLTVKDKLEVVKNSYTTIIGGTTPEGLAASIPEAAFGDGFLSRVIIAYQDNLTRSYHVNQPVIGGPTKEDLQERLAWIAHNAKGEYVFSTAADKEFSDWYYDFRKRISNDPTLMRKGFGRYPMHLRKVATLLRINRYEEGREVTLTDLREAKRLLDATLSTSQAALENVGVDTLQKVINLLTIYIRRRGEVGRNRLLTNHSGRGITSSIINLALRELISLGYIDVFHNGHKQNGLSSNGKEVYRWNENSYKERIDSLD